MPRLIDSATLFGKRLFVKGLVPCQLVWQEPEFEWLKMGLPDVLVLSLHSTASGMLVIALAIHALICT
jgi:hypothetical protein